jgi:hypothetical protein
MFFLFIPSNQIDNFRCVVVSLGDFFLSSEITIYKFFFSTMSLLFNYIPMWIYQRRVLLSDVVVVVVACLKQMT